MIKMIKKVAVVLMTVILMALMLPSQSVRAYDETYTVYVSVPEGVGTPYIWTWRISGNYFPEWPGKLMNDNGDGWYTYELPTAYVDLIISDGSSQTSDINVNGSDVEIIINDDWSYQVNYRDEYITEWENGINVTVTVPEDWKNPYIWAWDDTVGNVYDKWPGVPMNASGNEYTMELPDWVTGVIINANNAGIQTIDISVEPGKDIWLQVNSAEDIVVEYTDINAGDAGDGSSEEGTTVTGDDGNVPDDSTTTAVGGQAGNNDGGNKENNNNVIYIVVTVAVFVIIILIVTFTGNGRNKKHSQRKYVEDTDVKIDDADLDVDVDDIDV